MDIATLVAGALIGFAIAIVTLHRLDSHLKRKGQTGSYFWDLTLKESSLRPARGDLLFNYTRDSLAMVTTRPSDPNLGVVIVGNRKAPSWASNDDVRFIGFAMHDFLELMAPQPKARKVRV